MAGTPRDSEHGSGLGCSCAAPSGVSNISQKTSDKLSHITSGLQGAADGGGVLPEAGLRALQDDSPVKALLCAKARSTKDRSSSCTPARVVPHKRRQEGSGTIDGELLHAHVRQFGRAALACECAGAVVYAVGRASSTQAVTEVPSRRAGAVSARLRPPPQEPPGLADHADGGAVAGSGGQLRAAWSARPAAAGPFGSGPVQPSPPLAPRRLRACGPMGRRPLRWYRARGGVTGHLHMRGRPSLRRLLGVPVIHGEQR